MYHSIFVSSSIHRASRSLISQTESDDEITQPTGRDRSCEATHYHHVVGDAATDNTTGRNISLFSVTAHPRGSRTAPVAWQNTTASFPSTFLPPPGTVPINWSLARNDYPSAVAFQSGSGQTMASDARAIPTAPTHFRGNSVSEDANRAESARASRAGSTLPARSYYFGSQDWEGPLLYAAEGSQAQQLGAATEWEVVDPEEWLEK